MDLISKNKVIFNEDGLITDVDLFKQFKQEADEFTKEGNCLMDESLLPLLEVVNLYPGIATRFSCIGHREPCESSGDWFDLTVVIKDKEHLNIVNKVILDFNKRIKLVYDEWERVVEGESLVEAVARATNTSYKTFIYLKGFENVMLNRNGGVLLELLPKEEYPYPHLDLKSDDNKVFYPTHIISNNSPFEGNEELVYILIQCFLKYLPDA